MTHDRSCRCVACEMVRAYLAIPDDEHPPCCVCPLCAQPRQIMRAYEREVVESNTYGDMYARAINSTHPPYPPRNHCWASATGHGPNPFWGYAHGEIDPLKPSSSEGREQLDRDSIDALDLLADLGIPVRKDEP